MERVLRVFDRYGERKSRAKARMKFLIKDIGLDRFRELLEEETPGIPVLEYPIDHASYPVPKPATVAPVLEAPADEAAYHAWQKTNTFPQKQKGFRAVGLRIFLGNFSTRQARQLADLVERFAASEIRLSLRQNILIPYVREAWLPFFYQELKKIGLADPGYNTAADITACPGTDTCNLGIASSTGIATELERIIAQEYPDFIHNPDVVIKISGCMNACGQHTMAHIGFQGMSVRTRDKRVAPALQVLLGGGNRGDGNGQFADKVLKIPSKRGPQALRIILDDYLVNGDGRAYDRYYEEQGQHYFYDHLKHLADVSDLEPEDFIDWGSSEKYKKAIGVGECAGVMIDLVATLLLEAREKLEDARGALESGKWAASVYFAYSAQIQAAKALLTSEDLPANTHAGILKDFDTQFVESGRGFGPGSFRERVLRMNRNRPDADFANEYLEQAQDFVDCAEAFRRKELSHAS